MDFKIVKSSVAKVNLFNSLSLSICISLLNFTSNCILHAFTALYFTVEQHDIVKDNCG